MKKCLRNPKISGFRSGYPKIFGFSGQVQVGLPENIRVFGSGSGRVGSTRTRPETKPVFFRVPLYENEQSNFIQNEKSSLTFLTPTSLHP